MLKTTDGKTLNEVMKEFRELESKDPIGAFMLFIIKGNSSESIGFEGDEVEVKCNSVWIRVGVGDKEIDIPNYGELGTLTEVVRKAIEVQFFLQTVED